MQTQRITENDVSKGQIRIPRASKVMFPEEATSLEITVCGQKLTAKWDPGFGADKERSGRLSVGGAALASLVSLEEVLEITRTESGLVLDRQA